LAKKAKPGYKLVKSLFGKEEEIPEEWNLVKVGDVTDVTKLAGFEYTKYFQPKDEGDIPLVKAQNVQMGKFINKKIQYISKETSDALPRSQINQNDVLMGFIGEIGNVCLAPLGRWHLAPNVAKISPKNIDQKYLFYFLQSPLGQKYSKFWAKSTTIPSLSMKTIRKIVLYTPHISEQQKIASILSNIDYLIDSYGEVIDSTKQVKTGLMQTLLTKGIGHKKFKEIFLNSKSSISLGIIPESWDVTTFKDLRKARTIIEFQDGNHGELHPKKDDFGKKGRFYITATQITEGGQILLDRCKLLPENYCKKLRIGFTKAKDVLFTHNATVGRVAVMPENMPDSIVGTSVTYYRLNENDIDRFFFAKSFTSNFIIKQYSTEMDQSTRQQFSILKQATLKLPLPSLQEQRKIALILSNVDNKLQGLESKKSTIEKLKKGLMQKLLTGQIRVKV